MNPTDTQATQDEWERQWRSYAEAVAAHPPEANRIAETQPTVEGARTESFGEGYNPTVVDRFGVWLSARQIHRHVTDFHGKRMGDFGCGFHAALTRTVLDRVASAVLADVSLAPDLVVHPKIMARPRGPCPALSPAYPRRAWM